MKTYKIKGEERSKDFKLKAGGVPVPVYKARVSAVPFNQVWPGYQRPLDQTEQASFAYWDIKKPVNIEIEPAGPIKTCSIKPSSYKLVPEIIENKIFFKVKKPGHFVVEVNGRRSPLHVFVNPEKIQIPGKNNKKIIYFGPGIHRPGRIVLKDGQTVYIAGDAVVHAAISDENVSDIKIIGRGILDSSSFAREDLPPTVYTPGSIYFYNCKNIKIEGIVIRDPNMWTVTIDRCKNVEIDNIKLIGLWRYNSDGIDICNSRKIRISNCFIRSFDDSIVFKGLKSRKQDHKDQRPVRDVVVENCVIWNDWGRALEFGAETCASEIKNVVIKNCDIIRTDLIALDIQHGDCANISNIRFENIRFEMDDRSLRPMLQKSRNGKYKPGKGVYTPRLIVLEIKKNMWKQCDGLGGMKNIYFKNIDVKGPCIPESIIYGHGRGSAVENVKIENLVINGKKITSPQKANFKIGSFAKNIKFV